MDELLNEVFSEIHYVNILRPMECLRLHAEGLYDMSVNCADIPGAETVNILPQVRRNCLFRQPDKQL